MKKHPFSGILTILVTASAALALLLFPKEVSQAVRDGLTLCIDTLLPSLFPFFVLSSFLVKSGIAEQLGRMLDRFMMPLFHLPGPCSSALILGLIGGYPTGARTAAALYQAGQCSRREAQLLLGFCNNCGPAFLFGTIGFGMFGELRYGALLFLVHFSAAILSGLILTSRIVSASSSAPHPHTNNKTESHTSAFVGSVTDSFQAMLNLFSFVLCFSAIIQLIQLSNLPSILGQITFPFLSAENREIPLLGLLEMTCGVTRLTSGTIQERLILSSALIGWGGISVHCQVLSLLQNTDLSPAVYLKGKLLHALLSALLMSAILIGIEILLLPVAFILLSQPIERRKKSSGKSVEAVL